MEAQRYQVTQDGKDYILSTNIINNKIRIECQDNNINPPQRYSRDYSLLDLTSFSEIFTLIHSTTEAQNELDNAIERQQVRISKQGDNIMEIIFNVQVDAYSQELTFQLPLKSKQTTNFIQQASPTTEAAQLSPQIVIKQPIYKEVNVPAFGAPNTTPEEEDYPDVTYSTKPNIQPQQVFHNPPPEPSCGCVLEHDRINKIESNEHLLKNEHEGLRQRLNDLKMKIDIIKRQTKEIRGENGALNMKTLHLKKQYNNLIEAEAALRAENDELRREKHELMLKKNELGFYTNEPHSHDTVREVNIPLEGKRRRPTNVSKTEKQFGGGYTSNMAYKEKNQDTGYTSTYGNNNLGDFK